jgi:hypothetical protein
MAPHWQATCPPEWNHLTELATRGRQTPHAKIWNQLHLRHQGPLTWISRAARGNKRSTTMYHHDARALLPGRQADEL